MGQTRLAFSRSFDFPDLYLGGADLSRMVETLRHGIEWIERRITRHLIR